MNRELPLKRRVPVYAAGLLFVALFQLSFSVYGFYLQPDFLFLMPLLAAMWTPGYDGFVLGLVAGFLRDYAAGRGYGPGMLLGLLLGLLGHTIARDGWRQYAIRGSIAVVLSSVVSDIVLSFLAWALPFLPQETSLSQVFRVTWGRLPRQLLSNLVGALILTGYFALAFREWKRKSKKSREARTAIEAQHGG